MLWSIDQLSEPRRIILHALKRDAASTIAELSSQLKMTREAVRQHLLQLEHEGWITGRTRREPVSGGGRPSVHYSLTAEGENLFPKQYPALTVEVLDTVMEQLGAEAFKQVLSTMTEARIREWEPRLRGLDLTQRMKALKEVYSENDAFMDTDISDGHFRLIEHNCPFFHIASRRPVLCSVTVSLLTRLLGYRVVREERFQNGDGRCVFRVLADQPVDTRSYAFELEN